LVDRCDDVVLSSFARETIHRLGVADAEGSPHALTPGWRRVVDQLTGSTETGTGSTETGSTGNASTGTG
jgi:hypothetical protein